MRRSEVVGPSHRQGGLHQARALDVDDRRLTLPSESGPEIVTLIIDEPLDVGSAIAQVSATDLGGIAAFVGTVRDSASVRGHQERDVVRLDYEAHPSMAEDALAQVAFDAAKKWDVRRIVAVHRTGTCELGEPTVVVACGAPHRADALEACRYIIDTIKATVPIWKREVYADGSAWVGAEGDSG